MPRGARLLAAIALSAAPVAGQTVRVFDFPGGRAERVIVFASEPPADAAPPALPSSPMLLRLQGIAGIVDGEEPLRRLNACIVPSEKPNEPEYAGQVPGTTRLWLRNPPGPARGSRSSRRRTSPAAHPLDPRAGRPHWFPPGPTALPGLRILVGLSRFIAALASTGQPGPTPPAADLASPSSPAVSRWTARRSRAFPRPAIGSRHQAEPRQRDVHVRLRGLTPARQPACWSGSALAGRCRRTHSPAPRRARSHCHRALQLRQQPSRRRPVPLAWTPSPTPRPGTLDPRA
jgi:hypothetical protein